MMNLCLELVQHWPSGRRLMGLLGLAVLTALCLPARADDQFIVPKKVEDLATNRSCMKCHKETHAEWASSRHSRSSRKAEPITAAFYSWVNRQGAKTDGCDLCHAPMQAIAKIVGQPDAKLDDGVACVLCHSITAVHDVNGLGVKHYRYDFLSAITSGTRQLPEMTEKHNTNHLDIFQKIDACVGCHFEIGRGDYAPQKSGVFAPCQQCHMPTKKNQALATGGLIRGKVFRHLFEGGYSEDLLSAAGSIEGDAEVANNETVINVAVSNAARHVIPTGFPLRTIYLKAEALNSRNEVVWKNFDERGVVTDDKARFELRFNGADGLKSHHLERVTPLSDNRIPASGQRSLRYTVASAKVASIRLKLMYRLVTESAVQILGLSEAAATEYLIAEKTIEME